MMRLLQLRQFEVTVPALITAGSLYLLCLGLASYPLHAQQPPPLPGPDPTQQEGITELNRGPVHEGFAHPFQMKNGEGLLIDRQPPEPIQEIPSQQVPQGQEYQWVSGYWGWEPDEERFIWISGIWRRAPERKIWYPGYWTDFNDSYVWVSGYWAEEDQVFLISQIPPDPIPEDPGTAPSSEHFWVPGHWDISQGVFHWKKGFWSQAYAGRVWIPFRYLWTPEGYLTVPGYWDYQLEDRGVLFCPVVIDPVTYVDEPYCPNVVVRVEYLPTHLFIDNYYGHYCFGDYYGSPARRVRFFSWVGSRSRCYDPLLIFFRTHHHDRHDHFHRRHKHFHDHPDHRPRKTWRAQRQHQHNKTSHAHDAFLSASIDKLRDKQHTASRVKFAKSREQWTKALEQNKHLREIQKKRPEIASKVSNSRTDQMRELQKKFADLQREKSKKPGEQRSQSQQNSVEQRRDALKKLTQAQDRVRDLGKRDSRPQANQKVTPGTPPKSQVTPQPTAKQGPQKPETEVRKLAERIARPKSSQQEKPDSSKLKITPSPTANRGTQKPANINRDLAERLSRARASQKINSGAPKFEVKPPTSPGQVPRKAGANNQKQADASRSTGSVKSPQSNNRSLQNRPTISVPGNSSPKPSASRPKATASTPKPSLSKVNPRPSTSKPKSPTITRPSVSKPKTPTKPAFKPPVIPKRTTPSPRTSRPSTPSFKPPQAKQPSRIRPSSSNNRQSKPPSRTQPSRSFKSPSRSSKPSSRGSSGGSKNRSKKGR